MGRQPGSFDVEDRLKRLSDLGDHLEAFAVAVDFELFRPTLDAALSYADGSKGGRPPLDPVMMFKILVIQAANTLSGERAEYLINDRLSFMRDLGLSLGDRVPDARTLWLFRERLTRAEIDGRPAVEVLFARFDAALRAAGYIAMSGQIVDARLVAAPRQRNTEAEKAELKAGRIPAAWEAKPAKLRHKDRDARWTVKVTKAKPNAEGQLPRTDLAIPVFGYQSHIAIDTGFGFVRTFAVTDAAAYEGKLLREGLLDKTNTASAVWADTAYRSKANEQFMAANGFRSEVHRKKPSGKPMPAHTRRANGRKSKVRAAVEHVFADQKSRMGLFIRTVGLARARTKIGLANLTYNIRRLVFLRRQAACAIA